MAQGFSLTRKGVEAQFERGEVVLLRELITDLRNRIDADGTATPVGTDPLEAMTGISSTPVERPTDPVVARLLPDAHATDKEAADEFRRLAEGDLRAGRCAAYESVLEDLSSAPDGHVRIGRDQAEVWLRVINDLRLATGTIADVTEDTDYSDHADIDDDDPRSAFLHLYDWLTWLQSRLLGALTG